MDKDPIEVKQLSVNYGKMAALWDVSFTIPEGGNLVAILGPNGAGKSTLLKASLGLIKPISGRVTFFGETLKKRKKQIAYVPQKESIDWDFPISVFDFVLMGRYGHIGFLRFAKKEDREKVWESLEKVGLKEVALRQISQLSGGQQQRAFLARALCQEADLYLMDEPFSGIDIASKEVIEEIFLGLQKNKKTLLVVHHDLSSVPSLFTMVILLNMRLVGVGKVEEIFTKETILRTFGKDRHLFEEAMKRNDKKLRGFRD